MTLFNYPETPLFDTFRREYHETYSSTDMLDFHGTVKIHGANISIVYSSADSWHIQSRNRILSAQADHYGCFAWLSRLPLDQLAIQISENSWKEIVVIGEWAGKGVQQGVGINKVDKVFI